MQSQRAIATRKRRDEQHAAWHRKGCGRAGARQRGGYLQRGSRRQSADDARRAGRRLGEGVGHDGHRSALNSRAATCAVNRCGSAVKTLWTSEGAEACGKAPRSIGWVYGRVRSATNQPGSGTWAPWRRLLEPCSVKATRDHRIRRSVWACEAVERCCIAYLSTPSPLITAPQWIPARPSSVEHHPPRRVGQRRSIMDYESPAGDRWEGVTKRDQKGTPGDSWGPRWTPLRLHVLSKYKYRSKIL